MVAIDEMCVLAIGWSSAIKNQDRHMLKWNPLLLFRFRVLYWTQTEEQQEEEEKQGRPGNEAK